MVIDDDRITDVLAGGAPPPRADRVIDCGGGWLLPGLWDVHVHLQFPDPAPEGLPAKTIRYGHNAIEGLMHGGVTGIRSAGVEDWIDVAWRDAINSGRVVGPRIFASGYFITTTAGHALRWPFSLPRNGKDELVRAVREQIGWGVDHIKVNLSGGIMGPDWDRHWQSFLLPEELEAVFQVARQREVSVMSHAANAEAVKDAVRMGTWTVEHGYTMDDECIQMMLEREVFYVPTLGITHLTPRQVTTQQERDYLERRGIPEEMLERADDAVDEHRKWFQEALKAGVKMALGSDLGPVKDAVHLETALWVRSGATPMQTIKAATCMAAQVCHVGDEVGTVEPGKLADLLVVTDSPFDDIANLRGVEMVFKSGSLVSDKRQ